MTLHPDHDDQPTGPRTDQERELLSLYAELEEPDRVLLWAALLTLLDQQSAT